MSHGLDRVRDTISSFTAGWLNTHTSEARVTLSYRCHPVPASHATDRCACPLPATGTTRVAASVHPDLVLAHNRWNGVGKNCGAQQSHEVHAPSQRCAKDLPGGYDWICRGQVTAQNSVCAISRILH